MKIALFSLLLATPATAVQDSCGDKYTAQKSCDADSGCTWCKCAALPSACWTKANAKSLPSGVYQCDSSVAATTNSSAVPTTRLSNGVELPMLGLGDWQYTTAVAKQASEAAFAVGFTSIDTAHDYENQDGVGAFVKEFIAKGNKRSDIFITSKVPGCGEQGVKSGKECGSSTTSFFDEDLKLMGLDYADLMLVHFPPGGCSRSKCDEIQAQWKSFEDAYAAKKARAIGVSNYCQTCFECLFKTMKVKPMVNQVQYHVGMGTDKNELVSYLKKNNITMQAYSPLGDGSKELISGDLVTKIAKAHNKASGATVALKWLVQSGIPVVTKASDPTYLKEDFDLFDWQLTSSEMTELNSATSPDNEPSFVCKA